MPDKINPTPVEVAQMLLKEHEQLSVHLTDATDRGRGTKKARKDLDAVSVKLFAALTGRKPTAEELAACRFA